MIHVIDDTPTIKDPITERQIEKAADLMVLWPCPTDDDYEQSKVVSALLAVVERLALRIDALEAAQAPQAAEEEQNQPLGMVSIACPICDDEINFNFEFAQTRSDGMIACTGGWNEDDDTFRLCHFVITYGEAVERYISQAAENDLQRDFNAIP